MGKCNVEGLCGCGTAMVSPFKDGNFDAEAFRKLLLRQEEMGIDFIVALGSTAETACLSKEERLKVLEITRESIEDLPIVLGCGTNSLQATIDNIKSYEEFEPDAFLVVVPYYNKPSQEGLYQYFKAVSESTSIPIILYNVPGRTATNMTAETTLRLADLDNVIGIKEASGDLEQIKHILKHRPDGFRVLSGNDDQVLELMRYGAEGVISVASNIEPGLMTALCTSCLSEDFTTAEKIDRKLQALYHACFVESNPIPAKMALHLLGLCEADMRLPLTTAVQETKDLLKKVLKDYE